MTTPLDSATPISYKRGYFGNRSTRSVLFFHFLSIFYRQLAAVSQVQLIVGGEVVTESDTVRDLGVTLDAQLTMKKHVDGVARSCFYQLRQLRSIRRSVPTDALNTLVHA